MKDFMLLKSKREKSFSFRGLQNVLQAGQKEKILNSSGRLLKHIKFIHKKQKKIASKWGCRFSEGSIKLLALVFIIADVFGNSYCAFINYYLSILCIIQTLIEIQ